MADAGWERTALIDAVLHQHPHRLAALLADGADWRAGDSEGNTALHWAAMLESTDLLELLLDAGVDASVRNTVTGVTAVHSALLAGRADTLELLIDRGVDLTATDRSGDTALHWAALVNRYDAILAMLGAGADPGARNINGVTFGQLMDLTDERILSAGAKRMRRRIRTLLARSAP
ncbi:ankyrin repeat domain-containing protein [Nakamurella lactea]|uniref:ankyrin repeat domain-containing protein n=1 Tax=Nakamurella lactea TaxID=459515 RepID=UPI00041F153E|nr:ankyrin repeat domain-containing protein [Nakamurella lactea]